MEAVAILPSVFPMETIGDPMEAIGRVMITTIVIPPVTGIGLEPKTKSIIDPLSGVPNTAPRPVSAAQDRQAGQGAGDNCHRGRQ